MRTNARMQQVALVVLTALFVVLPACNKGNSAVPASRGVFYQPPQGKLVVLLSGSATEMAARAIAITGTARPSFLVSVPIVRPADIRVGVSLVDNKPGAFQAVDSTVTPVEGQPGVFSVRPNADLPPGLCALVVGGKDELSVDTNNAYPFKLEAMPAGALPAAAAPQ